MKMNPHDLKQGDLVRYTPAFIRSTGQYTPPINGLVAGFVSRPSSKESYLVIVTWSDASKATMVGPGNIEPYPRTSGGLSQSFLVGQAKRDLKGFRKIAKKHGWPDRELAQIVDKLPRAENPRRVTRKRPSVTRTKAKTSDFARLANKLKGR
jgi:hypothetical protein